MPSSSQKQHDLMQAVAHSKELSEQTGIPQKVAKEFLEADKKAGKWQKPPSDSWKK